MCLAVPGKVVSIEGMVATVDFGGVIHGIRIDLLPDAMVGEWVLAHAGFAIQRLLEDEAEETIAMIDAVVGASDPRGERDLGRDGP